MRMEEGEVPCLLDDDDQRLNLVVVHNHTHGGIPHLHPKQLRLLTLLDILSEDFVMCSAIWFGCIGMLSFPTQISIVLNILKTF